MGESTVSNQSATILESERLRQDLTYQQVADGSGVHVSRVHRILRGETHRPSFENVEAILFGLGRDWKWYHKQVKGEEA